MQRSSQLDQFAGNQGKADSAYSDVAFDPSAPAKAAALIAASRSEHRFPKQKRLDIGRIAEEVGEKETFSNLNPILSKYIHTTSFSVLSFEPETSRRRTALLFLDRGFWNLARAIGIVDDFLKSQESSVPSHQVGALFRN